MGNLCNRYPRRKRQYSRYSTALTYPSISQYQPSPPEPSYTRHHESYSHHFHEPIHDEGQAGLQNIGNTCFANAALQCILNTPVLISYFTNSDFTNISKFTRALSSLFQAQWKNKQGKIDPSDLLQLVWDNNQIFQPGQQNDAHEFLLFLLDQLHEELRTPRKGLEKSTEKKSDKYWNEYMSKNYSIISQEFQGQTKTTVVCMSCGYVKCKFEPFMYLSLSIPDRNGVSLEECLERFCEEDFLDGSEMWHCKKCAGLVQAKKQTQIVRLPKYLIVHLKRFKDTHRKIHDLVRYEELFQMRGGEEEKEEIGKYRLYAKVKHMGGINGGHYVAVAKQGENWYCFNDSSVSQEGFHTDKDTYLLFYQKVFQEGIENVVINES